MYEIGRGENRASTGRRTYIGDLEDELSKPVGKSSALSEIITFSKGRCQTASSSAGKEMKTKTTEFMERTVRQLRQSDKAIFRHCYAVLVGSVAEGTKIDLPDEFDFVIFLPIFNDKMLFEISGEGVLRSVSRKGSVVLKEVQDCDLDDKYVNIDTDPVRKTFVTVLSSIMSSDSEFRFDGVCYAHRAIAFRFKYTMASGKEITIKIDISFGIHNNDSPSRFSTLFYLFSASGGSAYCRSVEEDDGEGFWILGVGNMVDRTSTFAEVLYMTRLSVTSNRKICYSVAKCLINSFLPEYPKFLNSEECKSTFCSKSIFPSYYLKLIFFQLCEFYDDEKYWRDSEVGNRLIEIFAAYAKCLEEEHVYNIFLSVTMENGQYAWVCIDHSFSFNVPSDYGSNIGIKPIARKLVDDYASLLKSPQCVENSSTSEKQINVQYIIRKFSEFLCSLKNA